MIKTLILIAVLLAIIYLYYQYQSKFITPDKEEVFYDCKDFELSDNNSNHE